jgi:hypothetical protein
MKLEHLEALLSDQPHKITFTVITEAALNGYGLIKRYECKIEVDARYCSMCKQVDRGQPIDPFCPVNGHHSFKSGWVLLVGGFGPTEEAAIGGAIKGLPLPA